jgi:hypothetical protein
MFVSGQTSKVCIYWELRYRAFVWNSIKFINLQSSWIRYSFVPHGHMHNTFALISYGSIISWVCKAIYYHGRFKSKILSILPILVLQHI